MSDLRDIEVNLLRHLKSGGVVAVAIWGKVTITEEVLSSPKYMAVGLKMITQLIDGEMIRYGDPSPYKSGRVFPIVLTDKGKAVVEES